MNLSRLKAAVFGLLALSLWLAPSIVQAQTAPTLSQLGNPKASFYPLASTINGGGASDGASITSYTSPDSNTSGTVETTGRNATFHATGFGSNSVPWAELKDTGSAAPPAGGRMIFSSASGSVGMAQIAANMAAQGWSFVAVYKAYGGSRGQVISYNGIGSNTGDGSGTFDDDGYGNVYRFPNTSNVAPGQTFNQPCIISYTCSPQDGGGHVTETYRVNGQNTTTFSAQSGYGLNGTFYIGGNFISQYCCFFAYQGVLTLSQQVSIESYLVNYAGIPNYTAPSLALTGGNVISPVVGTTGRQNVINLFASASTGGSGSLTYQWFRALHSAGYSSAQMVTNGTAVGSNSLNLTDTGVTMGNAYDYALETTDSASTSVVSSVYTFHTGGSRLLYPVYAIDSTITIGFATGPLGQETNDAQAFEDTAFALDNTIAWAESATTINPTVADAGIGGNHPYPATNYGVTGSSLQSWVQNGGALDTLISLETAKGASKAKFLFFSGLYNDTNNTAPANSASAVIGYLHTAVQKLSAAGINLYLNLPWEYTDDANANALIPTYRTAILADTYNASTNPYGLVGHPNVMIGTTSLTSAAPWGGAVHPSQSTQGIADAPVGAWAPDFVSKAGSNPVFFGLPAVSSKNNFARARNVFRTTGRTTGR